MDISELELKCILIAFAIIDDIHSNHIFPIIYSPDYRDSSWEKY